MNHKNSLKNRSAVIAAFFINGFAAGSYMSRIPDFKHAFEVTDARFGFALLCSSIGVLVGLGPAGRLSAKYGSRQIVIPATISIGIAVVALGYSRNFIQLQFALFLFGLVLALQDVSMNAHAIAVEHELKKKLMSSFHATFSVGTLIGAFFGGTLSQMKVTPLKQGLIIALTITIINLVIMNWWLPASTDIHLYEQKERKSRPGIFLILGILGFCAQVGEGATGDWGGILARDTFGASPFVSTFPYIFFSATMVIGRFLGDRIANKYSARKILITSGLIVGFGLSIGLLIGGMFGMTLGWSFTGAGLSIIIPILFSTSGEIAKRDYAGKIAPAEGVAMVSGLAYFGFMAGPPLIGFLSSQISLRWAMLLPAVLAFLMALGANRALTKLN